MPELTPELWMLLPLALAAGIDLYLTLLIVGAAPTLPWWQHPLPGALGDLDHPLIVVGVGFLYIFELLAERRPASGLVWNAVHALIRPVSGALLTALLLHGQATEVVISGSLAGGALTALSHAVRSGGPIVRWLDPSPTPPPRLVSVLEDVLVLGLVIAVLDAPRLAFGAGLAFAVFAIPGAATAMRAFAFAIRLTGERVFQTIRGRSWTTPDRLPDWVRSSLEDDIMAPGGGLRGARAALVRMPGLRRLVTGWVVVRGDDPAFVHGRRGGVGRRVELGSLQPCGVSDHDFFRTLDLRDESGNAVRIVFFVNGPSAASLAAEFALEASSAGAPAAPS
ncbi:MAG: DUF4126 domain-containing protein [Gemmatimonadota bacterium]|nr:DUF4126 domain-containing protein [Gemmatimonadota bacterium]